MADEVASYACPDGSVEMLAGPLSARVTVYVVGAGKFTKRWWFPGHRKRAFQCWDGFVDDFESLDAE